MVQSVSYAAYFLLAPFCEGGRTFHWLASVGSESRDSASFLGAMPSFSSLHSRCTWQGAGFARTGQPSHGQELKNSSDATGAQDTSSRKWKHIRTLRLQGPRLASFSNYENPATIRPDQSSGSAESGRRVVKCHGSSWSLRGTLKALQAVGEMSDGLNEEGWTDAV